MNSWRMKNTALHHGDCREILPAIPSKSIHAIICDPSYPCIERDYGTLKRGGMARFDENRRPRGQASPRSHGIGNSHSPTQ